ncbi:ATPases associated with a variety of cellular activities [Candidatus Nitrosoglobus terrae]|uniref:ATPases associated with a variety of cellular activities n=1 Tax=Candidatus Nitrosoglobus terrae TaxID=1630141 RepID=A0A1Q2SND9_9GAMM|nr:hypothetical protein [Candidatus Nitrosoglobus terrae]BAW80631.1 ATPases associated with a variety of cellular activities [Candidatus Nitrosoglobus terrae]
MNQYTLTLKSIDTPSDIPKFHIAKINKAKIKSFIAENKTQGTVFLGNVKTIIDRKDNNFIDFISDEQLISTYGKKIASNSEIKNFSKSTIDQIKKHYSSIPDYERFPDRFERFFECLDNAGQWGNTRTELLDNFFSSPKGEKILNKYIEENKERYFKAEKQSYLEGLKENSKKEREEIEKFKQEKEELKLDIIKKSRERDELETNNPSRVSALTEEEKNITQSIADKQNKLDKLEEKHDSYKTIHELKNKIKKLEDERDGFLRRKEEMEKQVKKVKDELNKENHELIAKLVKLKPEVDALCGLSPKPALKSLDYGVKVRTNSNESLEDTREELINSVLDSLNSQGRKLDYYFIANLLITIAQCQFTLFSGLPGMGKTSLAKMLGISLGLGNRFLNIPVARGWTSYRDILGFYNALSQSYTSASSGLFELLQFLHKEHNEHNEHKEKIEGALSIILLDEFNLSQPEHYFSPFLEMADPESKRALTTGNPEEPYLQIPQYLRFLGTLNQDESVQTLTPRLLDRAAIINFDEFEPDDELNVLEWNTKEQPKEQQVEAISGNRFIEIFRPNPLEMMPQDIESVLEAIRRTLREDNLALGHPINISPRKIKFIRAYCNVAHSMVGGHYTALDYAISQHVIPLLNGYGGGFKKRLEALDQALPDEMEISKKQLKRLMSYDSQNMFGYGLL